MLKKFKTDPTLIEVKDTNRIIFRIFFFMDYNIELGLKNKLVSRMLTTCSNKYKTLSEFKNKKNELLIMDYSVSTISFINKCVFCINMTITKEGIIENYNIEKCIEFLHDTIFDPYSTDNQFNNNHFMLEKEYIYNLVMKYPQNIYEFIEEESIKQINEIEKIYLTHEEYLKNIESLTPRNVYEHYEKNVKQNSYITYIYGNLENKEKILKSYNKYFKQENKNIEVEINYNHFLKLGKYKNKSINFHYNQSVLNLFYQIDNIKESDLIFLKTLYYFLNARENNLIYNSLRNKHHLIYYSKTIEDAEYGYIGIQVFLNKSDMLKSQKIISQVIESIKIETNFNIYKERLLKALKYDIYSAKDNVFNQAEKIINKDILHEFSLEEKYNLINDMSYLSMKNFIERLKLTRSLIFIGDIDE